MLINSYNIFYKKKLIEKEQNLSHLNIHNKRLKHKQVKN